MARVIYEFICANDHSTDEFWDNNDPNLSGATIQCTHCDEIAKWKFPTPSTTVSNQEKAIRQIGILQSRQMHKDQLKRSGRNQRLHNRRSVT